MERGRTIAYFTLTRMGRIPHGGYYLLKYADAYRIASIGQDGQLISLMTSDEEETPMDFLLKLHKHYQDNPDYVVSDIIFND